MLIHYSNSSTHLLLDHDRGVPLETVLANVDVLARLHLLDDVLGVTDARKNGASRADLRSIAAGTASISLMSVGNNIRHGDEARVSAAHHETVLNNETGRLRHFCGI